MTDNEFLSRMKIKPEPIVTPARQRRRELIDEIDRLKALLAEKKTDLHFTVFLLIACSAALFWMILTNPNRTF